MYECVSSSQLYVCALAVTKMRSRKVAPFNKINLVEEESGGKKNKISAKRGRMWGKRGLQMRLK